MRSCVYLFHQGPQFCSSLISPHGIIIKINTLIIRRCQAVLSILFLFNLYFLIEFSKQQCEKWMLLRPKSLIYKIEIKMNVFLKDSLLKIRTTWSYATKFLRSHITNMWQEILRNTVFWPFYQLFFMTKSTLERTLLLFLNLKIKTHSSKHFLKIELKDTCGSGNCYSLRFILN
jgi:hypothetical protein